MRLLSLASRGLIPNPRHELRLDVAALPRGVVALVGPNGIGKSSFVEATIPGALFREFPTRGSFSALAVASDAFVETVVEHGGRRLRIRQEDGAARVEDVETGAPLLRSAGVREFDAWAAKELPNPDLFLAADFVAQRSAGLLDLTTGERKSVILSAIGVERFEALAADARAALATAETRLRDLGVRREEARRGAEALEAVRGLEDAARLDVVAARGALDRAREALDEAKRRHAVALEAFTSAEAARARRKPLVARREEIGKKTAALDEAAAKRRAVAEEADRIRAAADALPPARERLDAAIADERAARDAAVAAAGAVQAARGELRLLDERLRPLAKLADERAHAEEGLAAAEDCARELPALRDRLSALRAEGEEKSIEAARLREIVRAGLAPRVAAMRGTLQTIEALVVAEEASCAVLGMHAAAAIDRDDRAEKEGAEAPAKSKAADEALDAAREAYRAQERRIEEAQRAERDVETAKRALATIEERERIRDETTAKRAEVEKVLAAAQETAQTAEDAAKAASLAVQAAREAVAKLEPLARRMAEVLALDAEAAADAATARALGDEVASIEKALAEVPEPGDAAPPPNFEREERDVREAEAALQRAAGALGAAEAKTRAAQEAEERRVALDEEIAAAGEEAADWKLLATALGRDGIQALEIDAAGPELAALANGFLAECYGPRWSVSLATTRPTDKGDREVYDLLVHDAEAPPEKATSEIRWKSGGESVIVGEAIALALSTFAAARAGGAGGSTWVRDESGAALDGPKGIAYVRMLRRAAELAGAERVLLVSHSPAVQAAADGRVFFEGSSLRVE